MDPKDPKDTKSLEVRLEQLEQKLDRLTKAFEPQAVSEEEMRAYYKVSSMLGWDDGGACGINECRRIPIPIRCQPIVRCIPRCIVRCINECTCGPCGGGWSGGGGGFGDLGG